mgnify:CR=1 FL=1
MEMPPHTETSFTLVEGTGDTDNASFEIDDDQLKLVDSLNFEAKPQHSILVKATDAGGLSIERSFLVKVENLPEAPIAIAIDNDAIEENLKKGATVGNLIATDEDAGEKHTYKLIDNPDGEPTDNAKFTISGTRLRTAEPFDFDATPELTVYLEVTDRAKLTYSQAISITVKDANDPPTGLTIDNNTIAENLPTKSVIGTLTAEDPDAVDSHTFSLSGGKDVKSFSINGNHVC